MALEVFDKAHDEVITTAFMHRFHREAYLHLLRL
jgi:hypothetical protein